MGEWALPWNYSDSNNPDARRFPPAFRASSRRIKRPTSLVAQRNPGCNSGLVIATSSTSTSRSVWASRRSSHRGRAVTWIWRPQTGFNHGGGNAVGKMK
jgi:hypothetical protein